MIDKQFFDDMTQKFTALLPESVQQFKVDFEKNTRAILQNAFSSLDLVTREEFDVQANVLKKTRAKLDELEKHVAALEEKVGVGKGKAKKAEETK